jgi:hypothetical protein
MRIKRLVADRRGVSAIEAAILLPVLIFAIVGIAQLAILHFAHAGLRNLIAEGARLGSISPRPTDASIKARLRQGGFGLVSDRVSQPVITYGKVGSADYADLEMSYTVKLNFLFWTSDVPITERRRVFIYPEK